VDNWRKLWAQIQDLLTSAAAALVFGARQLAEIWRGLNKKQRNAVLAVILALIVILSLLPGPAQNGGSGSSGSSDRPSTSRRTCLTCLGSGKCDDCGGSGYSYVRGSGGDRIKTGCNTCHGSGDCKNSQCKNGMVPA